MWKRCLGGTPTGNARHRIVSTRSAVAQHCYPGQPRPPASRSPATPAAGAATAAAGAVVRADTGMDDDLFERFGVSDAHCHPQDDPARCAAGLGSLAARHLAVMGTRLEDWEAVERLSAREPHKVIPCFGVHPWFAHRHALDVPAALAADPAALLDVPANGKDHPSRHPDLLARLAPAPPDAWLPRLRALLERHPQAVVGEFGLDRAAVVPGTRLQPSWAHQLALTELHLRLAAELGRPASLHCVRGFGHLQEMLRRLGPEGCPPKIMLHSYGGSVDLVKGFIALPGGVGSRIYFSFSSVINGRTRDKLLERLRAVPPERLLVESDQSSPDGVDPGLREVLAAVAEARGMTVAEAAAVTSGNFREFYATSLERMAAAAAALAADAAEGQGQLGTPHWHGS